jgi:hypothetical protein
VASIRTTVKLPESEYEELKWLADRRDISFTHALRQAIQTELLMQRIVDEGAKFLVQPKDGEVQQLVFAQAAAPVRAFAAASA